MDVRHFVWSDDPELKHVLKKEKLAKESNDDTATAIQAYVKKILSYRSDRQFGKSEYWLFAGETLAMRVGDCEDGAILIASLLLNALPVKDHWRVRVAAGWVQEAPTAPQGGHAYCVYCRCTDSLCYFYSKLNCSQYIFEGIEH